ncbi:hypothetical protein HBH76_152460 [Parastagonospora nodorum]|nr:hypothetical protein HBH76_152460 [Parastagonospora nodorum]
MLTLLRAFAVCTVIVQIALGAPASQAISKNARCGASFGSLTCKGGSFGNCCSQYGHCGSSSAYCGQGCQSGYGTCSSSPSVPPPTQIVSTDGRCGTARGISCSGSKFGDCCSDHGWCGRSAAYRGKGCNPLYGNCTDGQPSSTRAIPSQSSVRSVPLPSSSQFVVSTNARCGSAYEAFPKGMTCRGSKFGNCCSQYSYCGSGESYCGKGCQPGFGNCDARLSAPVSSSTYLASTSKTSMIEVTSTSSATSTFALPSSSFTPDVFSSSSTPVVSSSSSISALSLIAVDTPSLASSVAISSGSSDVQSTTTQTSSSTLSQTPVLSSLVGSPMPTPTTTLGDSPTSSVVPTVDSSTTVSSSEVATSTSTSSSEASISTPISLIDNPSTTVASTSSVLNTPAPAPTSLLLNGDFEATAAADIAWKIRLGGPTYNFMTSDTITAPYSGTQVGSLTYSANSAPFIAMSGQNINLRADTNYKLSAHIKSSMANPPCSMTFTISQTTGTSVLKVISTTAADAINTEWQEVTGSYLHGSADLTLSINVRTLCTRTIINPVTFHIDAITFIVV